MGQTAGAGGAVPGRLGLRVMVTLCCLVAFTMFGEIVRHHRWIPKLTGGSIDAGPAPLLQIVLDLVTNAAGAIDDEPTSRLVAQHVLEREGMEVVTARDGADEVKAFNGHRDKLVAILLDITMPPMGGASSRN